ncbi:MAG: threonine aldolase [Salinivirgaceae bacterium]|nr:MAG: threonine aldolase [Salinivirgaceae bacterium]
MITKGFASDNNAGAHPQVLAAMIEANQGHAIGYGDDKYTKQAIELFKKEFGEDTEINFLFTGTATNVMGIMAASRSFNSVICTDTAHINVDECGAPEKITGSKVIAVENVNGKLVPEKVIPLLHGFGFEHHSQPGILSISQVTEMGTVYQPDEIKTLAKLAHDHGMLLHMDGARIANAAVSLNMNFREFTRDCGVDLLSFGGTKNGLIMGEALLFFKPELVQGFKYLRKQHMQLFSKMRFVSAQFIAYFKDNLWKKSAEHSNKMAQLLVEKLKDIQEVKITQQVEANGIFAIIPEKWIKPLQEKYFFYMWNEELNEVRWMTSFDTTEEDIENFTAEIKKLAANG